MNSGLGSAGIALVACGTLLSGCELDDCPHVTGAFPQHPSATVVSMDALCGHNDGCPPDRQSAIKRVMQDIASMPGGCDAQVLSGCGVDTVQEFFGTHGDAWSYDSKTGELIGGDHFVGTQQTLEGCSGAEFVAGKARPPCAQMTERSLCPPAQPDAGVQADGGALKSRGGAGPVR